MEEKKRIVLPVKMDGRFSYSIVLEDSFEQLARELAPLETESHSASLQARLFRAIAAAC